MPPSPRLSACMMNTRYFAVTTTSSAQRMSDRMPYTLLGVTGMPYSGRKHSRSAYNGLVPMSPYTTPSAASVRNASRRPTGCAAGCADCGVLARGGLTAAPITPGTGVSWEDERTRGREDGSTGALYYNVKSGWPPWEEPPVFSPLDFSSIRIVAPRSGPATPPGAPATPRR